MGGRTGNTEIRWEQSNPESSAELGEEQNGREDRATDEQEADGEQTSHTVQDLTSQADWAASQGQCGGGLMRQGLLWGWKLYFRVNDLGPVCRVNPKEKH